MTSLTSTIAPDQVVGIPLQEYLLPLKQGIRDAIVFVKSIFGHYQLLLYLLNGAVL